MVDELAGQGQRALEHERPSMSNRIEHTGSGARNYEGIFSWFRNINIIFALASVFFAIFVIYLSVDNWNWITKNHNHRDANYVIIRDYALFFGLLFGAPFVVWRTVTAHRQAGAAQEQAKTAEADHRSANYQKGAELLGSGELPTRVGGIHTLTSLAQRYPESYHVQHVRLLSSIVKHSRLCHKPVHGAAVNMCPLDVEAATQAVGQRGVLQFQAEEADPKFTIDLSQAALNKANLTGSNLSGVLLIEADLRDANLVEADLERATLLKANLMGADLSNAFLRSARCIGSDLTGAKFIDADMKEVKLAYANLTSSVLWNADLTGGNLWEAVMKGALMENANLSDANLTAADLTGSDLKGVTLTGAILSDAILDQVMGLTQEALNGATVSDGHPPSLNGALCADTQKPLVWQVDQ